MQILSPTMAVIIIATFERSKDPVLKEEAIKDKSD
jgi:hypothetical protein